MANTYPKDVTVFLAADAIRQEMGGKVSLLGVFANGSIVLPQEAKFPAGLPLAFYFAFADGEGKFSPALRIIDPSGKQVTDLKMADTVKKYNESMQFVINFGVFLIPMVGKYQVDLMLDGRVYVNSITISVANNPS